MRPLSIIVLIVVGLSVAVALGQIGRVRVGRPGADPFAASIVAALSAAAALLLSHHDPAGHDILLFAAGVATVVSLTGFVLGRRA